MCYFKSYDSSANFTLGLDVIPRVHEYFDFSFIRPKIGTSRFWVKKVSHEINDGKNQVHLWLEGDILNRYREMAVEEALFKGWIGYMDIFHKTDSAIDDVILEHLRR